MSRNQFEPVYSSSVKNYPAGKLELLRLQNRYIGHQGGIWKINGTPNFLILSLVLALEEVKVRGGIIVFPIPVTDFLYVQNIILAVLLVLCGKCTLRYMLTSYYPVVPAFVGTTSNSDMTGFETSGGCRGKGGWVVFVIFVYASVIYCNVYVAQPHIFNKPGVAGAVLQTPSSLIQSVSQSVTHPLWKYFQTIITSKPLELRTWHFDTMFTIPYVSHVTCHMSHVTQKMC